MCFSSLVCFDSTLNDAYVHTPIQDFFRFNSVVIAPESQVEDKKKKYDGPRTGSIGEKTQQQYFCLMAYTASSINYFYQSALLSYSLCRSHIL